MDLLKHPPAHSMVLSNYCHPRGDIFCSLMMLLRCENLAEKSMNEVTLSIRKLTK
jgi:hypothetical protein